ncbi:hypothetical protein TESG_08526 [Trichophyton tonsurans CBS 112818]|uniref:Uncharacterized protein n=1 Tax=Trichophyton tonsurans (strain CBS 112818) TaxID=647933 RepID=F2S3B6_TRIT1|nr:hypothetical protein TESG_08526 [Trichophyton tonsurans CBS 112818]
MRGQGEGRDSRGSLGTAGAVRDLAGTRSDRQDSEWNDQEATGCVMFGLVLWAACGGAYQHHHSIQQKRGGECEFPISIAHRLGMRAAMLPNLV